MTNKKNNEPWREEFEAWLISEKERFPSRKNEVMIKDWNIHQRAKGKDDYILSPEEIEQEILIRRGTKIKRKIVKIKPPKEKTSLYRHFDVKGNLLYVGISRSILNRTSTHEKGARWWDHIRSMKIEHYSTRELALEAEARAIVDENPEYNLHIPKRDDSEGKYNKPKVVSRCSYCRARDHVQSPIWELFSYWDYLEPEELDKEILRFKRLAQEYLKSVPDEMYKIISDERMIGILNDINRARHGEELIKADKLIPPHMKATKERPKTFDDLDESEFV
jgi:hypothetical protein